MTTTYSTELTPAQTTEIAVAARERIRAWSREEPAAILDRIGRLGAAEIEASAALTERLTAQAGDGRAEKLLRELGELVSEVHAPPPRTRFGFARTPPGIEARLAAAEPALVRLLQDLATERDRLARAALGGRSLADRLAAADAALDRAACLLGRIEAGLAAAAREMAPEQPARAAFLTEQAAPRVVERSGDVLAQLSVIRQARLSLALLLDGEEALVRAIDRTRQVMVSALRTAVAAARAMREGTQMAQRAAALDTAEARRTIEAAVGEMSAALAGR